MALNFPAKWTRKIVLDEWNVKESQRKNLMRLANFYEKNNRPRTPLKRKSRGCVFCGLGNDVLELGGFVFCNKPHMRFAFHERCLTSTGGIKMEATKYRNEFTNFFYEFAVDSLVRWLEKNYRRICVICQRGFASIPCNGSKGCLNQAHVPCALKDGWRFDHELCRAFCVQHLQIDAMIMAVSSNLTGIQKDSKVECLICREVLKARIKHKKVIATGCCGNRYYHYDCMQRLAYSRCSDLQCPHCNKSGPDKDAFQQLLSAQDIFIPDWIADFDEIEDRICLKCEQPNNLIFCWQCGSGVHQKCEPSAVNDGTWLCMLCTSKLDVDGDTSKENENLPVDEMDNSFETTGGTDGTPSRRSREVLSATQHRIPTPLLASSFPSQSSVNNIRSSRSVTSSRKRKLLEDECDDTMDVDGHNHLRFYDENRPSNFYKRSPSTVEEMASQEKLSSELMDNHSVDIDQGCSQCERYTKRMTGDSGRRFATEFCRRFLQAACNGLHTVVVSDRS